MTCVPLIKIQVYIFSSLHVFMCSTYCVLLEMGVCCVIFYIFIFGSPKQKRCLILAPNDEGNNKESEYNMYNNGVLIDVDFSGRTQLTFGSKFCFR